MAITLNDQLYSFSPKSLDGKYGKLSGANTVPYASVAEANASILVPYRHKGLMVTIDTGTGNTLYWYKEGTADGDLVPFISAGSPDTNFANTDLTFTVDRSHTLPRANHLKIGAADSSFYLDLSSNVTEIFNATADTSSYVNFWTEGTSTPNSYLKVHSDGVGQIDFHIHPTELVTDVWDSAGSLANRLTLNPTSLLVKTLAVNGGETSALWYDESTGEIKKGPVATVPTGITGGVVSWVEGLTFHVTAADYYINGAHYSSPATDITLDAADGTDPRLDVLALTTANTVAKITGVANPAPAEAQIDYNTQLRLTSILLNAGSLEPTGIIQNVIYDEGVEWAGTSQGTIAANFLSSAITPFKNSFEVSTNTYTDGSGIMFSNNVPVPISNNKTLNLHLYSTEAFGSSDDIKVVFLKNGVVVSDTRSLPFTKSTVNSWQYVSFALTDYAFTSTDFNQVKFIFSGASPTRNVYWDYILLQDGIVQADPGNPGFLQGLQDVIDVNPVLNKNVFITNPANWFNVLVGDETYTTTNSELYLNTASAALSSQSDATTSSGFSAGSGGIATMYYTGSAGTNDIHTASGGVNINLINTGANFTIVNLPSATAANVLYYDSGTHKVTYGAAPSGGGAETLQQVITNGNVLTVDNDILTETNRLRTIGGDSTFANAAQIYGVYPSSGTFEVYVQGAGGVDSKFLAVSPTQVTVDSKDVVRTVKINGTSYDANAAGLVDLGTIGGGGSTYTVDNGLTENVAGNFQLGGTLLHATTIDASTSYYLQVTGSRSGDLFKVDSTGNSSSLAQRITATTGKGLIVSNTGFEDAVQLFGVNGQALYASSDNTHSATFSVAQAGLVDNVMLLSNAATAVGNGSRLVYQANTNGAGASAQASITAKWTDDIYATRSAELDINLANNGAVSRVLHFAPGGTLTLDKYAAAVSGTAVYNLGVDSTGKVITTAVGGTDTNFANTNLTLSANRTHTIPNNMGLTIRSSDYTSYFNLSYNSGGSTSFGLTADNSTQSIGVTGQFGTLTITASNIPVTNRIQTQVMSTGIYNYQKIDNTTNPYGDIGNVMYLSAQRYTNTKVAGIGARLVYMAPCSTGSDTDQIGSLTFKTTDITTAADKSKFELAVLANGAGTAPTVRMEVASTGQAKLNAYTSATAFSGTPVANISVDSSGNLITTNPRAKSLTPTSSADASGNTGDIAYDDNYIYVKTSAGWKRSALSTF